MSKGGTYEYECGVWRPVPAHKTQGVSSTNTSTVPAAHQEVCRIINSGTCICSGNESLAINDQMCIPDQMSYLVTIMS
eukprot:scaffold657620_cov121-Prasinocladus_malaysianus.AAC.1